MTKHTYDGRRSRLALLIAWLLVGGMTATPLGGGAFAQGLLDEDNQYDFTLRDGTEVRVLGAPPPFGSKVPSKDYYFLPTNLRLASRSDGTPQFLFLKYVSEEEEAQGGLEGAVLHFLMEWGLTADQERELQNQLARV
ncbi:MAG: hypothetical protein JSW46_04895, partial [Gemmatimonadota bacterium]